MSRQGQGKYAIRSWTLYVIRFTDGTYYIGITAYTDFMRRIKQHGTRNGARWALGKQLEEVVEIRKLGRIPRVKAENIENDVTLEYRKQYGRKVRGGYNAYLKNSLVPNYTPGSIKSLLLILAAIVVACAYLIAISLHS